MRGHTLDESVGYTTQQDRRGRHPTVMWWTGSGVSLLLEQGATTACTESHGEPTQGLVHVHDDGT